jgi:drug/metabolite transporter (DMT)-like permease
MSTRSWLPSFGEAEMNCAFMLENGVVMMWMACIFFAAFDSLVKYLTAFFTPVEIALVRFGFGALVMFPSILQRRVWEGGKDFLLLILRGLSGAGAFYSFILSLQHGTLSVTVVLFFTSPFWSLFLGAYFIDEHLTKERILCIIIAFTGIIILINPAGKGIVLAHLFGLASGVLGGVNNVITRHLRVGHSGQVIYTFQCIVGTLVTAPWAIGQIDIPEFRVGVILFVTAALGLLGQVAMNHAFRFIRAAEGGTLLMSEAILTALVGILLFHEPLSLRFVLGSIMILGGGIYLGLHTDRTRIEVATQSKIE